MDGPALFGVHVVALVDRLTEQVEDAAQSGLPHGNGDRTARVAHLHAARQAIGRVHGHAAHAVIAQVLLHLHHQRVRLVGDVGVGVRAAFGLAVIIARGAGLAVRLGHVDLERGVDLGQVVGEGGLDDHAGDRLDPAEVLLGLSVLRGLAGGLSLRVRAFRGTGAVLGVGLGLGLAHLVLSALSTGAKRLCRVLNSAFQVHVCISFSRRAFSRAPRLRRRLPLSPG